MRLKPGFVFAPGKLDPRISPRCRRIAVSTWSVRLVSVCFCRNADLSETCGLQRRMLPPASSMSKFGPSSVHVQLPNRRKRAVFNTVDCGYDGGDCCECDCGLQSSGLSTSTPSSSFSPSNYSCGMNGYVCVDPASECFEGTYVRGCCLSAFLVAQ